MSCLSLVWPELLWAEVSHGPCSSTVTCLARSGVYLEKHCLLALGLAHPCCGVQIELLREQVPLSKETDLVQLLPAQPEKEAALRLSCRGFTCVVNSASRHGTRLIVELGSGRKEQHPQPEADYHCPLEGMERVGRRRSNPSGSSAPHRNLLTALSLSSPPSGNFAWDVPFEKMSAEFGLWFQNWLGYTKKRAPIGFHRVVEILQRNSAPVQVSKGTALSEHTIQSAILPHWIRPLGHSVYNPVALTQTTRSPSLLTCRQQWPLPIPYSVAGGLFISS